LGHAVLFIRWMTQTTRPPVSTGRFELVAPFALAGDQPGACDTLARGLLGGDRHQTLLGVTGSGKTLEFACVNWDFL